MDKFTIEGGKIDEVILELLIRINSRQRALDEYILNRDAKNEAELKEAYYHFDKSIWFHREEILKYLLSHYADLKGILPPKVDPPKD